MEQPSPMSPVKINPDSSVTTPVTPTFPSEPDPIMYTELQIARHHVNTSRDLTVSLLNKIVNTQECLPLASGFEKEQDNMLVLRRWADNTADIAWQVLRKASRLVDDVDYLILKLKDE